MPLQLKLKIHSIVCALLVFLAFTVPQVSSAMTEQECLNDRACANKIGGQLQSFLSGQGEGFYGTASVSPNLLRHMSKTYLLVLGTTKPFAASADQLLKLKDIAQMHVQRGVLLPELTSLVSAYVNDDLVNQCKADSKTGNVECLFFQKKLSCAAFATHRGSRLWTARHCINSWLKDFDESSGVQPKAFVYSTRGELVAGPLDLVKLKISLPFRFTEGLYSMKDDFFEIKLDKRVSSFFEILPQTTLASSVLAVGFPASTGSFRGKDNLAFRERRDHLNAVESRLKSSQGIILDPLATQMAFSRSETYAPYLDSLLDARLRVSSADAVPGMSGGPLVDQSTGKVVGIVTGGLWTVIMETQVSASVAVRPPSWQE